MLVCMDTVLVFKILFPSPPHPHLPTPTSNPELLNLVNTLFSLIHLPVIGTDLLGKGADAALNNGLDGHEQLSERRKRCTTTADCCSHKGRFFSVVCGGYKLPVLLKSYSKGRPREIFFFSLEQIGINLWATMHQLLIIHCWISKVIAT